MEIIPNVGPEELAQQASEAIIRAIQNKPDLLLCLATGNSPTRTYQQWVNRRDDFPKEQLRILKLDEWGGIPEEDPQSCEQYLRRHVLQPLAIGEERFTGFRSNPSQPEEEVKRIRQALEAMGGIDLCVLGIGLNGHIAFNEPANTLQPHAHIAQLSEHSMSHAMAQQMPIKPTYGLTLGMSDILKSREIIMLIQGESKRDIATRFLKEELSTQVPASFLWLHPKVTCFIDKAAYPA